MENIQTLSSILSVLISLGTLGTMIYALSRFITKPHETLEKRVLELEVQMKDVKSSLLRGNDKFKEHDEALSILLSSVLALVEFEIQYCIKEGKDVTNDLVKMKDNLHQYLSKR